MQVDFKRFYGKDKNIKTIDITTLICHLNLAKYLVKRNQLIFLDLIEMSCNSIIQFHIQKRNNEIFILC